jgi:hypothetical protein
MRSGRRRESDFRPCRRCTLNSPLRKGGKVCEERPVQSSEVTLTGATCELGAACFFGRGFPSCAARLCISYHLSWGSHWRTAFVLPISYHQERKYPAFAQRRLVNRWRPADSRGASPRNDRVATSFRWKESSNAICSLALI